MINVIVLQNVKKQKKSKGHKNTVLIPVFLLIGDHGKRDWYQVSVAKGREVKKLDEKNVQMCSFHGLKSSVE